MYLNRGPSANISALSFSFRLSKYSGSAELPGCHRSYTLFLTEIPIVGLWVLTGGCGSNQELADYLYVFVTI